MPTMTLLPDGLAVSGWNANTGTVNDALTTNNGDTTYAEAGTNGETCTLTFAAPSVAESGISSITSVQFLSNGRFPARGGGGTRVEFLYVVGGTTGFGQNINYPNNFAHSTRNGIVRTVNTAGAAWSYSDLEDVNIKITKIDNSSPDVRITKINLLVTYEEVTGYGNLVSGIASANIGKINGIATANIGKVNGVD